MLTRLVSIALLLTTVNGNITGYTQIGDQTRLLGSSFGVPGANATFDYVVRVALAYASIMTDTPVLHRSSEAEQRASRSQPD